jgi:hypothetical protein
LASASVDIVAWMAVKGREGVEANTRLTASTSAVLFLLLAAEGFTILRIHGLLSAHVFIGMLLIPPVLVKIGSTSYRFVRYYVGSPAYRESGPPPPALRVLGPFVVVLTVAVLGTGVALMLAQPSLRPTVLSLHKASFVVWFGAVGVHVLGHLADTTRGSCPARRGGPCSRWGGCTAAATSGGVRGIAWKKQRVCLIARGRQDGQSWRTKSCAEPAAARAGAMS